MTSPNSCSSARIRDLGVIEAASAFRHDMNIYLSVEFGATISSRTNTALSQGLVFTALRALVNRHPALSTVIIHENSTDTYKLKLLSKVDLANNVMFKTHDFFETLEDDICRQVSSQFDQINSVPPWRLWLTNVGKITRVIFFFHHSVFDGTSAKLFLIDFKNELNSVSVINESSIVPVPTQNSLIPSVDTLLNLDVDLKKKPKLYNPENDVNVWSGNPVSENNLPLLTKSRYLVVENIKPLVKYCKANNTSITAFLLIVALESLNKTLIKRGANYEVLRGSVPRNLRSLINQDAEYGDFVSSISFDMKKYHDKDLVALAQEAKHVIFDSINRGAQDSIEEFADRAGDQRYKYEHRPGNKRTATMEVSTILVDDINALSDDWMLTDFSFLQGTSAEGAPLTCSAISQRNGCLKFSFSWSTETMEDEIVEDMHREFSKTLDHIIELDHLSSN